MPWSRTAARYVPVLTEQDYYRAEIEEIEAFAPLVPIDRVWVEHAPDSGRNPRHRPARWTLRRGASPDPPWRHHAVLGRRVVQAVPDGTSATSVPSPRSTASAASAWSCGSAASTSGTRWALTGAAPSTMEVDRPRTLARVASRHGPVPATHTRQPCSSKRGQAPPLAHRSARPRPGTAGVHPDSDVRRGTRDLRRAHRRPRRPGPRGSRPDRAQPSRRPQTSPLQVNSPTRAASLSARRGLEELLDHHGRGAAVDGGRPVVQVDARRATDEDQRADNDDERAQHRAPATPGRYRRPGG